MRDPVVRPREPLRAMERRRGHADHRERLLVQPHGRPDHARIATERAPPQSVAQDDVRRRVRAALVRRVEEPSDLRLNPQHVEVVAGDGDAAEPRPRVAAAQARFRVRPEPDHVAEAGVSLAQVLEGGIRRRQVASAHARPVPNLVQALRVAHLERPQHDRVEHSEHEAVGPDRQREGEHGYKRERGGLPEAAERVASLQQQIVHNSR